MNSRIPRRPYGSLSVLVLATVLAGTASAQGYTGVWNVSTVSYDGGGGLCPSFSFDQLAITDSYPSVTVTTNSSSPTHPGTMTGTFSSPAAFTVSSTAPGPCFGVTYTMTVGFLYPGDKLTGGLVVDWVGFPCTCPEPTLFFAGTCSSAAEPYCTAGTSASGCHAALAAAGTASATASSGFRLDATQVEGSKTGMFYYAANGRQASPWGNGTSYQCVVPPVRRGGLLTGTGTPGACDGSFSQDLNARWCPTCPKPTHNPGSGAIVQAQFWYRDPLNTSNQTTSLSNAVEFSVCP